MGLHNTPSAARHGGARKRSSKGSTQAFLIEMVTRGQALSNLTTTQWQGEVDSPQEGVLGLCLFLIMRRLEERLVEGKEEAAWRVEELVQSTQEG